MKKSKYNILFEEDNNNFVFNSFTTALDKVNNDFLDILNSAESLTSEKYNEHKPLIDNMIKSGYLVSDDYDELKALQFYHLSQKFNGERLFLTIAPTMGCNFACPYCYESVKCGTMTQDVRDRLIEFVKSNLENKTSLHVLWFGGEPLLAKEIIYDLSNEMISLCEENGVRYKAKMVSNSYLLDDETMSKLKQCKVEEIQVTIDGPARIHNSRRKLKNSDSPTFDRILSNISKLKKFGIHAIIRINVDKTNVDYIGELADTLAEYGLKDTFVYLGYTTEYDRDCPTKMTETCLDYTDFSIISAEFYKLLIEKGFSNIINNIYPSVTPGHCSAEFLNSFIIDPLGNLYKCENELGETENCIGNIFNVNDKKDKYAINGIEWLLSSPFSNENCISCNILPLCMGGCQFSYRKTKKLRCLPLKYNIVNTLKLRCKQFCTK